MSTSTTGSTTGENPAGSAPAPPYSAAACADCGGTSGPFAIDQNGRRLVCEAKHENGTAATNGERPPG